MAGRCSTPADIPSSAPRRSRDAADGSSPEHRDPRPAPRTAALRRRLDNGIGDDADIDASLVMRIEKIIEHHRAAALAPRWTVLAVVSANVIRRFFRRVDMCVPIDDHAELRSTILCLWPSTR